MVLTISKQEIFNEVEKRSSLEGFVIPERYDGVWANEKRGEFLNSYWIEGYNAVIQLMKRYLAGNTVEYTISDYDSDEVVTITAAMPARYNSLLDGSVTTSAKMMIADNVLSKWLEVQLPESSKKYSDEAASYAELLKSYILYRVEPISVVSSAKADDVAIESDGVELSSAKADDTTMIQGWGSCCSEFNEHVDCKCDKL